MTNHAANRACATCSYFVHEDGPYGQCHFQPPAPVWAKVGKADWCGQYDAAPAPIAAPAPAPVLSRRKGGAA